MALPPILDELSGDAEKFHAAMRQASTQRPVSQPEVTAMHKAVFDLAGVGPEQGDKIAKALTESDDEEPSDG